jgi:hypothetical protein
MPSDSPSQGSRRHFHRGRRGHDRRGGDRRGFPQQQQQPPPDQTPRGDHVDVGQIMRDIRAKIAQRHGVELTDQQVQELAARRLESILDPRTVKPSLLEQLRRSAGARPDTIAAADRASLPYAFEDTTLYDSPSALTRFIRRLLNPILKMFFNPNPLIRALHIQSGLNAEAARREAERDERQAEWNALHYEILQRIVKETAKVSLEAQSLALRIESLSTKVDFNERRVRGIEGLAQQSRPGGGRDRDRERERDATAAAQPPAVPVSEAPALPPTAGGTEPATGEAPRRRRRRRRGRRGGGAGEMAAAATPASAAGSGPLEVEEIDEDEPEAIDSPDVVTTGTDAIDQMERASEVPSVTEAAPERVTPQLTTTDPGVREEAGPDVPAAPTASPEAESDEPQ